MNMNSRVSIFRLLVAAAALAVLCVHAPVRIEAQGGVTITFPTQSLKVASGPDFATDNLLDPWDFSNREDVALDPAQFAAGWSSFAVGPQTAGGTATNSSTNFAILQRPWNGVINPGRNGQNYPIDSGVYNKLAIKLNSSNGSNHPRLYWFHDAIGASPDRSGWRFLDPNAFTPAGNSIYVIDMNSALPGGQTGSATWSADFVRGLAFYPFEGTGVTTQVDWVRLTTADTNPGRAHMNITWNGTSSGITIRVTDPGQTWSYTIATGVSGHAFDWNYGVLPPGSYKLFVGTDSRDFTINTPPSMRLTDPDDTGGDDFATDVLGNPWDMNDSADTVENVNIVNHTFGENWNGLYNATSDGQTVAFAGAIPVGDPQVYMLSNQHPTDTLNINTSKYHRLTFGLQVDRSFDLQRGSVARVFWGSDSSSTGGGTPYNVTTSKDIITWPGMNQYTIDLATLTAAQPNGGLEVANAVPWTQQIVRHLRIDPHEFAEVVAFHIDNVKLAADDETKSNKFTIRWVGSDADGDSATVTLFYDTDRNPGNGMTQIVAGLPLAQAQYVWSTGSVPAGTYWIYAVVGDAWNGSAQYSSGPVKVTTFTPTSEPVIAIDTPQPGQVLTSAFEVGGWAIDHAAPSGTGVDDIQFFVHPGSISTPGVFIGHGRVGLARADVGAVWGTQFTNSGYHYTITGMSPGNFVLEVQAHSTVANAYNIIATVPFSVSANALMSIDIPTAEEVITAAAFGVSGWAIDRRAPSGTGVDQVHLYAYKDPGSGTPPIFLGIGQYGQIQRPDVASAYGSQFTNSGYALTINRSAAGLVPGTYNIVVWVHSSVDNTFIANALVQVRLQ